MGGIISSDGSRAVLIDVIHDQDAACYLNTDNNDKKYNLQHHQDRGSTSTSIIPGRVISTPSSSSHSSPAVSDVDVDHDQRRRIIGDNVTTAHKNHQRNEHNHHNQYTNEEEEKSDGDAISFVYRSGSVEDRHQAHPALTLWCYPPQKKKSRDAASAANNACSPCLKQRQHPPAITLVTEESSSLSLSSCNVLDSLGCGRKRVIAAHQRNDGSSARIGQTQTTARVNKKLARTHMLKRHDESSSRKETTANGWYNTDWWIGEDATDLIIAEPTPAVKVAPLKSRDEKQMEVHINAEHYDRATWRMYNRITRARLAAQQSRSSLPPMECHLPGGGSGKSHAHIDRASILGSKAETNYADVPADYRNERKRSVGSLNDDIFSLDLES